MAAREGAKMRKSVFTRKHLRRINILKGKAGFARFIRLAWPGGGDKTVVTSTPGVNLRV